MSNQCLADATEAERTTEVAGNKACYCCRVSLAALISNMQNNSYCPGLLVSANAAACNNPRQLADASVYSWESDALQLQPAYSMQHLLKLYQLPHAFLIGGP